MIWWCGDVCHSTRVFQTTLYDFALYSASASQIWHTYIQRPPAVGRLEVFTDDSSPKGVGAK